MHRRPKRARREVEEPEQTDSDDDAMERPDSPPPPRRPRAPGPAPRVPGVHSLVVGGTPASVGQFPFQAGLLVSRGERGEEGLVRCGATLVSDRWLITAAHCVKRGTQVRVFLGSHHAIQDAPVQLEATLVLLHPLYSRSLAGRRDLALIRLPKPVRFSDRIRPVQLPAPSKRHEDFAGKIATLSGWGKTSDDDHRPIEGTAVLRFAKERVLTHAEAEKLLERKLEPHFLCVRGARGSVSCNGDSGSPLTVQGPGGQPMLVGVVSHRYSMLCSASKAHVCTRITSFLPWIRSVIGEAAQDRDRH